MPRTCSHCVIGVLVEALGLDDPDLRSKAAANYFYCKPIRDARAVHLAFAKRGLARLRLVVPPPPSVSFEWLADVDPQAVIAHVCARWDRWNHALGLDAAVVELSIMLAGGAVAWFGSREEALRHASHSLSALKDHQDPRGERSVETRRLGVIQRDAKN